MLNRIFIAALCLLIVSCSSGHVKDTMGFRKKAPDAFKVVSNSPLSMPPDFSLRAPELGVGRPKEFGAAAQAEKVLFEKASLDFTVEEKTARPTSAERHFLNKTGAKKTDANIKSILRSEGQEAVIEAEEESFLAKIASYKYTFGNKGKKSSSDPIVDAGKERARLYDNKRSGKSVVDGDVPVVSQEKKGILDRIF